MVTVSMPSARYTMRRTEPGSEIMPVWVIWYIMYMLVSTAVARPASAIVLCQVKTTLESMSTPDER